MPVSESGLRKSEHRYRGIFDSIDEAVCIIERLPIRGEGGRDYCFVDLNRAMQQLFGGTNLSGQSVSGTFSNESETWYDDFDRVLLTGNAIRVERESVPRNRCFETVITRMDDDDGTYSLLVVMKDITERKQGEAALRSTHSRQAFLLRFSDTIRQISDPATITSTATGMVRDFFGVDRCFISRIAREQGKAWIEHESRASGLPSVEGEVNLAAFPEVMRVAETGTMVYHDVPNDPTLTETDKAALGGLGFGAFIAAVLRKGERNYFWDLVVASITPRIWKPEDISLLEELAERTWAAGERARTEKALLETEKLAVVGRLASSIAHEINNPLEAVTNLLYLIEVSGLPETSAVYLHQAQTELMRVSAIATETLRFSRQNTSPTEIKLSGLIESVLSLHEARLKAASVTVERRYHEPRNLLCFPNELRQVIANLVGNAIEAMSATPRPRLSLRVRETHDPRTGAHGIRLTVSDTGSGIPQSTLKQIWEPFFTTKGSTGNGLGLWVSNEIIRKHHGRVHVLSRTDLPRRGTTFSIFFPHLTTESIAVKPPRSGGYN